MSAAAALAKVADAIAAEVNAGRSLKDVAAAAQAHARHHQAGSAHRRRRRVPPALVAKLFEAKPGQAVTAPAGDSVMVAQSPRSSRPIPPRTRRRCSSSRASSARRMQSDLFSEFDQALRRQFPVEVNQTNLDRLL